MSSAVELAGLPAMDRGARVERLRAAVAGAGADALLLTRLVNIRWLTGFTGSAALVLVTPDAITFVTDGRYAEQADDQLRTAGVSARIEIGRTQVDQRAVLAGAVTAARLARLGLEADDVTWAQQRAFSAEWFPAVELVPTIGLAAGLRRCKDEAEIARIAAAATIADEALGAVLPLLLDGPSEREVALALEVEMRRRGATGPSFQTIIASGPNAARPHARPSERRVARGDLVVVDFGAVVDGYCSDTTRTFSVGQPTPEQARMLAVVTEAQAAGVAAVRPGVACRDVDVACREVIGAAGFADAFVHGTGHGVGLEIHEDPRLGTTDTGTLAGGYVVTVEPGVYVPGSGGVRVEDSVVVDADGARPLTGFSKQPVLE